MNIKRITKFSKNDLENLNLLLLEWSANHYQITKSYFKVLIKKSYFIGLYDRGAMVGTVTLVPIHKISGLKGSIEHLLVSEKYRGLGQGEKLMKYAIALAKKLNMVSIVLTCEFHRTAANALYKKIGFKIKELNFYELKIND